ncbi:hypothetical protein HanIR_Chr12g0568231 [Helianthus annuus]|nr:hypothetical protein HanIR_Chr12g0568231 [Helianthus annuus]
MKAFFLILKTLILFRPLSDLGDNVAFRDRHPDLRAVWQLCADPLKGAVTDMVLKNG